MIAIKSKSGCPVCSSCRKYYLYLNSIQQFLQKNVYYIRDIEKMRIIFAKESRLCRRVNRDICMIINRFKTKNHERFA